MSGDQYLKSILSKYNVRSAEAMSAAQQIYPVIERWGNGFLNSAEFSGSLAKGTGVSIGTDADIFLSVSSITPVTLSEMYESLYIAITQSGYQARKQNVSIGTVINGYSIDLVPGRRQSQHTNDHSLYKNKTGTWTLTNVLTHINYVKNSGRIDEIRILKAWRHLHKLSFPSFFLEMATIDALKYSRRGDIANNTLKALQHFRDNIKTARYVDPSNTNNIISDDLTPTEKSAIESAARSSAAKPTWQQIVW